MKRSSLNSSKSSIGQVLLTAFEKSWNDYLTELERCKTEFSNEAVHDLRMAIQTMVGILQLSYSIFQRPRLQKVNQALEFQLEDLDSLWDTQIILAEISETMQELHQLHGFQKYLQIKEEKKMRALRKKIRKFNTEEISRRLRKEHLFLETKVKENLKSQFLRSIDDAYMPVRQRFDWASPARPTTVYRLGAVYKTFLYRVKFAHPILREFYAGQLEQMDHYLLLMTELWDIDLLLQALAEFSERSGLPDMESVRTYYERRYTEALAAYAKEMDLLHQFWRPAPDQPFPRTETE